MSSDRIAWKDRAGVRRVLRPIASARHVRPGLKLISNELARRRGVSRYRMQKSGLAAHLRHPHLDMWVLDEIFQLGNYEYPDEVARLMETRRRPRRIVDIGACVGLASLFFLERFPEALITALEPDAWNREVLMETVRANNLGDRWTVIPACASVRQGTVPFISDHFLSRVDPGGEMPGAETAPTIDVLPILDGADLVKMDIQGGEWEILSDPRFAGSRIGAIVIEYHPYLAPSAEPHREVHRLLREAGFAIGRVANEHAGEGTIWAWKADRA